MPVERGGNGVAAGGPEPGAALHPVETDEWDALPGGFGADFGPTDSDRESHDVSQFSAAPKRRDQVTIILGFIAVVVLMVSGYLVHAPLGWVGSWLDPGVPIGLRAEREHHEIT